MSFASISRKLFIVATPIGNLKDITIRALDVLREVDLILCEDTRVTKKLLTAYNITTKCAHFDDHSSLGKIDYYLNFIENGRSIALVTDAGTPLISDPGYRLVNRALEKEIKIESLPGACAFINALVLSGFQSLNTTFIGFLPHEQAAKTKVLEKYKDFNTTLVFFESPNRLLDTLKILQKIFPNAKVCVAREMTKRFEEITKGSLNYLLEYYNKKSSIKGEIVVLLEVSAQKEISEYEIKNLLSALLSNHFSLKDAVNEVNHTYNEVSKKKIYSLALAIQQSLNTKEHNS